MKNTVFCTVEARNIQPVVRALRSAGLSNREISVLAPHAEGLKNADMAPDALHGAEAGAVLGGVTAELATVASLIIEGIGPFVVAGPVAMLFAGAVGGGLVGGMIAATGDLGRLVGIPREVSHRVEKRLDAGRGLVFVHYRNEHHRKSAVEVFGQFDATDIESSSEPGETPGTRSARPGP
jgi:hypothetical protein